MKILVVIIAMILIPSMCPSNAASQNINSNYISYMHAKPIIEDSLLNGELDELQKKSPIMGLGIAIFPGIILRGAGHYYAGSKKTAIGLFIITAISLYATKDSGIGVGPLIFLVTWAYDIIAAPLLCIDYNRNLEKSVSIQPYSKHDAVSGHQIGFRLNYNF